MVCLTFCAFHEALALIYMLHALSTQSRIARLFACLDEQVSAENLIHAVSFAQV
jgi:hypothetical protein